MKLEQALMKHSRTFRLMPWLARYTVHVVRKMYNAAKASGKDFGEECL